jgi:hypothetical protein
MGVILDSQGAARETVVFDANVTIEWLEFKNLRSGDNDGLLRAYGANAKNVVLQNLLIHDFFDGLPTDYRQSGIRLSDVAGKSVTVRNVMIWDGDEAGIRADEPTDALTIENCTIDDMRDATSGDQWGVYADATPGVIVRNTIVTRSGLSFAVSSGSFAAGPTSTNNISSDASARCRRGDRAARERDALRRRARPPPRAGLERRSKQSPGPGLRSVVELP